MFHHKILREPTAVSRTTEHQRFGIHGRVSPGFEPVQEAFVENFGRRRELGGSCCAFFRGEKVVDLWGGVRNKQTGEPWDGLQFSLGFMKRAPLGVLAAPSHSDHRGAGGSLGFADLTVGVGYAYVTIRMGARLTGDPARSGSQRRALLGDSHSGQTVESL